MPGSTLSKASSSRMSFSSSGAGLPGAATVRRISPGAILARPLMEPEAPATMLDATCGSAPIMIDSFGKARTIASPCSRLPLLSLTPITCPGWLCASRPMLPWSNSMLLSWGMWYSSILSAGLSMPRTTCVTAAMMPASRGCRK